MFCSLKHTRPIHLGFRIVTWFILFKFFPEIKAEIYNDFLDIYKTLIAQSYLIDLLKYSFVYILPHLVNFVTPKLTTHS